MRRVLWLGVLMACKGEPSVPTPPPSCDVDGFADRDGDGFGDPDLLTNGCVEPVVQDDTDCDDGNFFAQPGRDEVCDGFDNDCDGLVDALDPDASSIPFLFPDEDGDGWGTGNGRRTCDESPLEVDRGGDCDDLDPDVHPGAQEVCGGADEDCNGFADDADPGVSGVSTTTWYEDGDLDGHGGPTAIPACVQPAFTTALYDDCDDADPTVSPSAPERCNDRDDDCDAGIDGPPFSPDVCGALEGTWTGPYQVTLVEGGTTVTCSGTATVTIDRAQDPVLQGLFACDLDTVVAGWDASQAGVIEATVFRDGLLEGHADAFQGVDRDWQGSIVGETLTGSGGGLYVSGGAWDLDFGWALAYQLLP
jgi:hypothetical protein